MFDINQMMQSLPAAMEAGASLTVTMDRIAAALETIALSLDQLCVLKADEVNYGGITTDHLNETIVRHNALVDPGDHHVGIAD
jgi:hypothetical protein